MNSAFLSRLDKILALADSPHEGEALLALRKARQMLEEAGTSFRDLAELAARRKGFILFRQPAVTAEPVSQPSLGQKLLDEQLAASRRRIAELESQLAHSRHESRRWHRLALDSVDTLWKWAGPQQAASSPRAGINRIS